MGLLGRSGDSARSQTSVFDALVVGLGNPGSHYARTRHNVGQEVVVELARRAGEPLKAGRDKALVAEIRLGAKRAVLAFPTTFMNESGLAVRKLVKRYGFAGHEGLIVVQDELDLEPGTVRLKVGGGLGGHNGLRSITDHMGTQDYVRVRIGVGKPPHKDRGADHVLRKVPAAERQVLDVAVNVAADAVESILDIGFAAAMNVYTSR